jgi:hypothetical protein
MLPRWQFTTTPEIRELATTKLLDQYQSVNVNLSPFFETMIVSSIVQSRQVSMVSETYATSNTASETCTLVLRDEYVDSIQGVIFINQKYALIPQPSSCLLKTR